MVKSDGWIIQMAQEKGMIEPFEPRPVRTVQTPAGPKPVISYGVSSYGYDIRVARNFKVLDPVLAKDGIVDPKQFDMTGYAEVSGDEIILPPHGMAIAQSLEYFRIPRDVLVVCFGKSTYSRCGILVSISPLEPEWEGTLTFAITNTTSRPAKIYAAEGIAQILFMEAAEVCRISYADKQGKYQRQSVLTPPKV